MRLAIDCRMSGKSGIGTFLDSMLPSFKESGAELLLIGKDEACSIKPFSLKEMLFFPRGLLKKINSCDAYFSPYCNIPGRLFSRGIRVPIFTTIHDVVFLDMPEIAGALGTLARHLIYERAVKKSRTVFTVSVFSKGRIEHFFGSGKKIVVVHNGCPLYNERPSENVKKENFILFIGNIKRHKGLSTLVPAFIKFRNSVAAKKENSFATKNDALPELFIVGSKENFRTSDPALEALLSSCEKGGVVWTGFVPDEKLKDLIGRARFLVQPSLYEGFGIPPLQALYSGTKALVSDIPVFREVYERLPVTFFKAGNVDDLAQKMEALYFDESPLPDFEKIYSYKKSAALILKEIAANL